jgi:hypothetical protein
MTIPFAIVASKVASVSSLISDFSFPLELALAFIPKIRNRAKNTLVINDLCFMLICFIE